MSIVRLAVIVLWAWFGVVTPALCQSYPARPVRIVVPFQAGGTIDVLIRAIAAELSIRWNQPVIIENRSGAGGIVGVDTVAKANADGYTLLATSNSVVTAYRFLYKSLPFDADKDLAPMVLIAGAHQLLVANSAVPANNLKELIALARAQPGKLAYGSDGMGSLAHQLFGMLAASERIDMTHVAYRGSAPKTTALVVNEVQLSTASLVSTGPLLKAGSVKALAYAGPRRLAQHPNLSTTSEQGFPALKAYIWQALFAQAAVPQPVIDRIAADVIAILKQPQFAQRNVTDIGLDLIAGGPAQLSAAYRDDVASSELMIRVGGIKVE